METVRKQIDLQVLSWAFVGPFVALVTFFIILLKDPVSSPYFAFSILVGLPLCWKWKKLGLAIASTILAISLSLSFSLIPSSETLWHLGMALAVIMSFVVTALSLEESEQLLWGIQEEAQKQIESFTQGDEKLQNDKALLETQLEQLNATTRELTAKAEQLEKVLAEKSTQLQASRELVDLARDELITLRSENENILQELFQKRHEVARLHERIEDFQEQVKILSDNTITRSKVEAELQKNKHELNAREQQISILEKRIDEKAAALHLAESDLEKMQIRQKTFSDEMGECIDSLTKEKGLLESNLKHLQEELESMRGLVGQIEEEKETFRKQVEEKAAFSIENVIPIKQPESIPNAEKMYLQLRKQFEEKSSVLNETRKELFLAQEKLLSLKLEEEEAKKNIVNIPMLLVEQHLNQSEREKIKEAQALQKEIVKLEELITVLTKMD